MKRCAQQNYKFKENRDNQERQIKYFKDHRKDFEFSEQETLKSYHPAIRKAQKSREVLLLPF